MRREMGESVVMSLLPLAIIESKGRQREKLIRYDHVKIGKSAPSQFILLESCWKGEVESDLSCLDTLILSRFEDGLRLCYFPSQTSDMSIIVF